MDSQPKASINLPVNILKALLGAGLWGFTTFILKVIVRKIDALETITLRMIMLTVMLLLMMVVGGRIAVLREVKKSDVYMLGLAGLVALALGNLLLYTALRLIGLSIAAPLSST